MIKVEKVPIKKRSHLRTTAFGEYVTTLRDLEVGESFVYKLESHHRLTISILQHAFDRKYTTERTDGKGMFRVGRLE